MTDNPDKRVERLLAASPFAMPRAAALELMQERRKALLAAPPVATQPAPDFTAPAPIPPTIIDTPEHWAERFWAKRDKLDAMSKPKKPKTPPGRRPTGELDARYDKFRIVDGDVDKPE